MRQGTQRMFNASRDERHRLGYTDLFAGHIAPIGQGFDPTRHGALQAAGISRIDIGRHAKVLSIAALDQVYHYRAVAQLCHVAQFLKVPQAPHRHRVRELGEPRLAHHVNVLDLDISPALDWIIKQDVDAAPLAVALLPPEARVSGKRLKRAVCNRFRDKSVRMAGVNSNQDPA